MSKRKERIVVLVLILIFSLACNRVVTNLAGPQGPVEALAHYADPIDENPEGVTLTSTNEAATQQVWTGISNEAGTPQVWTGTSSEAATPQAETSLSVEGFHQFTLTSCTITAYTDRDCSCGDTDGVIEIYDSEVIVQFIGRGKIAFNKQDSNMYTNSRNYGESTLSNSTLTLKDNGFLYITDIYDTSDNTHVCTINKIGIFIE